MIAAAAPPMMKSRLNRMQQSKDVAVIPQPKAWTLRPSLTRGLP
jgi:hypothetical protein